jgi:hypothetical protein
VIPLSSALILLQGLAEVLKCVKTLKTGVDYRTPAEAGGAHMSPEVLGLVLLACMFVVILGGFPISFTLIMLGLVFGYIGTGQKVFYS